MIRSRISAQGHNDCRRETNRRAQTTRSTLEYPGFRPSHRRHETNLPSFDRVNKSHAVQANERTRGDNRARAQSGNNIFGETESSRLGPGLLGDRTCQDRTMVILGTIYGVPRHLCRAGLEDDFPAENIEIGAPSLLYIHFQPYPTSCLPKPTAPCRPIHHGSKP